MSPQNKITSSSADKTISTKHVFINIPQVHYHRHIYASLKCIGRFWISFFLFQNKSVLSKYRERGNHGYDNRLSSMKPIFLARGPNIKEHQIAPTFRSVDIYPMICKILGITPSPNNGSLTFTSDFLVDHKETNTGSTLMFTTLLLVSSLLFYKMAT